jgi:hypothetical protein
LPETAAGITIVKKRSFTNFFSLGKDDKEKEKEREKGLEKEKERIRRLLEEDENDTTLVSMVTTSALVGPREEGDNDWSERKILDLIDEIRDQNECDSPSNPSNTSEGRVYRALQDICPERRIFERDGTVLGDLSLQVLLMQSASPPTSPSKPVTTAPPKAKAGNGTKGVKISPPVRNSTPLNTPLHTPRSTPISTPLITPLTSCKDSSGPASGFMFSNLFSNHLKPKAPKSPQALDNTSKTEKKINKCVENLEAGEEEEDDEPRFVNTKRKYTQFGYFPQRPDVDLITIVVSGLRVSDLFYVDRLWAPRPYLELCVGDEVVTTDAG